MVAAAAADVASVTVAVPPRVAILGTGVRRCDTAPDRMNGPSLTISRHSVDFRLTSQQRYAIVAGKFRWNRSS